MKDIFGIKATVEELIAHKNQLLIEELRHETTAVYGLHEMTKNISKIVAVRALASSSFRNVVDTVIDELSLTGWFSVTVAGDEVAVAKPDPAIFLKASELLGVPPEECVVVEDSANGILSATTAGMRTIGFINPLSGNQDLSGAERIFSDLRELPSLLKKFYLN